MAKKEISRQVSSLFMLISGALFALGGVCIRYIPWSPMAINGCRSIYSVVVLAVFMLLTKHKLVVNRSVLLGAFFMCTMMFSYVIANKLTTAANAIVLQFTAPVFIILFMAIFFKEKPDRLDLITCVLVLGGIVCFFLDSLTGGGALGNAIAILSGALYAGVFMLNKLPGGDPLSSIILGQGACALIGAPFLLRETDFTMPTMIAISILGLFQLGLAYVFFSVGIRKTPPVTASLMSGIEPVLNPLLVALFTHEIPGPIALLGAVIVIGSILVYNVLKEKAAKKID